MSGIFRTDMFNSNTPEAEDRLPLVGPRSLGKRTRRKDRALLPSFAMSSGRLFLDGLLASIARLRFTDTSIIGTGQISDKDLLSNGKCVFSSVSHRRGSPHKGTRKYLRSFAFICG